MKNHSDHSLKSRREFLRDIALSGIGVGLCGFSQRGFALPPDITSVVPAGTSPRRRVLLQSEWRFQKENEPLPTELPAIRPEFDDSSWEAVGVPHCYNDMDSFENANRSTTYQGIAWYRTRFKLDESARGKKVFLEFGGVVIAAAVYINGKFKPGSTAVPQPGRITHVGGFLPFVLDVTEDVLFSRDNVLAVRVGNVSERAGYAHEKPPKNRQAFYTVPGFGTKIDFGMGFGGIVCPVALNITDQVHVPSNAYSPLQKWGSYVGTTSASDEAAQIRIQTNVANESATAKDVTLVTQILDAENKAVQELTGQTKSIKPGEIALFDQTAALSKPALWYPNNSPYGKPYLYRVVSEVRIGGDLVDRVETPLGIRMITWDGDYCYINGNKHLLNGMGHRNMYPALGSAVPAELQWNDIKSIAECGGNLLRVGHVPPLSEMIEACDVYGILVLMNSGDNEWALKGDTAFTYKREYDRDMIIRYRSHPSLAGWESNNGLAKYSPKETMAIADQWDFIQPRIVGSRDKSDYFPVDRKIMIGYTNKYKKIEGSPSMNWEVYGAIWKKDKNGKKEPSFAAARFDYDNQKTFADHYVTDYLANIRDRCCGWVAWMLAETQGEGYVTYLNGMDQQKSLGSCAMDGNRFPKLTYQIFKNALWVPFSIRPGVALQSHWNYSGTQDVDAWSNCPSVELYLNGVSLGTRQPDQNVRCTWKGIPWQSGTLKAVGRAADGREVCADVRQTAGDPHHIVLSVKPRLTRPSGETFEIMANGSDAAIVTAKLVDIQGNWGPLADQNIRFKVSGPGLYRGSYNFYVTNGQPLNYHAPGDFELQAEGGLMRVAVRSTFQPGTVQVSAEADGLGPGSTSFETKAPAAM